ncbi:MAG: ribosomal-processing cysteine protease Prp [Treponema sp.]|jgi:uncharacterized protein YsxB (DUF464 family)|nr:ribosomal-processing cysteine protease Prp [Treponema sp.]
MIEIDAVFDERGVLMSCKVSGHATAGHKGRDIVCAAVSVLARTAMRVLSGREGILVRGGAPQEGVFWMEMDYTTEEGGKFLFAVGNFLMEGLGSVSADYPDYCKMTITERRN